MNAVNCAFERAPTLVAASWPSLNSIRVGMPRMPYLAGTSRFSSTFIFAIAELAVVVLRDLVQDRRDHLARAAPLGPVVDQDRRAGLDDVGIERCVGRVGDQLAAHDFLLLVPAPEMETKAPVCKHASEGTIIVAQAPATRRCEAFLFPMATIARSTLDVSGTAPWDAIAEHVRSWAEAKCVALRDVVVLLPFVQLLAPARRSFAAAGTWMPRIETTRTLAASLGPPPRRGAGELGWGVAHDTLLARQHLARQPWAGEWSRRDPRGFAQGAARVVATAHALMTAAAAVPPDDRGAWWQRARELLLAQVGPGGKEKLLAQVALEWAARSAPGATDRLFALQAAGWAMVVAGGIDPLARSLLERATVPVLQIDTDVDPVAPFRDVPVAPPSFHVCDGFEDEAAAAAAQVLVHVDRGETPVALIAQDRALVRRIRALLERSDVVMRDETGWKLATTRAGATVMALLSAARPDASADAWLDWLKAAPIGIARGSALEALEAALRKAQVADAGGLARLPLDTAASALRQDAIRHRRCTCAAAAALARRLARRARGGARERGLARPPARRRRGAAGTLGVGNRAAPRCGATRAALGRPGADVAGRFHALGRRRLRARDLSSARSCRCRFRVDPCGRGDHSARTGDASSVRCGRPPRRRRPPPRRDRRERDAALARHGAGVGAGGPDPPPRGGAARLRAAAPAAGGDALSAPRRRCRSAREQHVRRLAGPGAQRTRVRLATLARPAHRAADRGDADPTGRSVGRCRSTAATSVGEHLRGAARVSLSLLRAERARPARGRRARGRGREARLRQVAARGSARVSRRPRTRRGHRRRHGAAARDRRREPRVAGPRRGRLPAVQRVVRSARAALPCLAARSRRHRRDVVRRRGRAASRAGGARRDRARGPHRPDRRRRQRPPARADRLQDRQQQPVEGDRPRTFRGHPARVLRSVGGCAQPAAAARVLPRDGCDPRARGPRASRRRRRPPQR